MIDYEKMLPYCKTDIQTKTIKAVIKAGTVTKAARDMGKNRSTVRECVDSIHARAAREESSLLMDDGGKVAPGRVIKMVTHTLKDPDTGERTWIRTTPAEEAMREMITGMISGFTSDITRERKTKAPKQLTGAKDLMNCIVVGDPHLDMLSYDRETGQNWDLDIACKQHIAGVIDLIDRAPEAEFGVLAILGDSLHRDSLKAITPGSGNVVDVDGRLGKSLEEASNLFRAMVTKMLKNHKAVSVVVVRGNHSETLELALQLMLKIAYENEPRVTVVDNIAKHIPFVFGKNFMLFTHGDRLSDQKKADIAVANFRKLHGAASFTHVLCGHVHHASTREVSGVTVETFQALPAADAWHFESGYVTSTQAINMLTYHAGGGITNRVTAYPRIFMQK